MYGWRARIGHILPSIPLDNVIYEFAQMLPDGVIMSYTSLHVQQLVAADLDRAMEKLEMKRIVLAAPYEQERLDLLSQFLARRGIEVLAMKGLNLRRAMDMGKLPMHASYQLAREAFRQAPEADGVYMPCSRVPVVGSIEDIETDLGKPVVTSAQAMVWWALDVLDIHAPISNYGALMKTL